MMHICNKDILVRTSSFRLSALGAAVALLVLVESAGAATVVRTTAFDYNAAGQLTKEIIEPGSSDQCLVFVHQPDANFGEIVKTSARNCTGEVGQYPNSYLTVSYATLASQLLAAHSEAAAPSAGTAPVFTTRDTKQIIKSADGRFDVEIRNALGHSKVITYDERFAVPSSVQSPNDGKKKTLYFYDSFGRLQMEQRPDGNGTAYRYGYCKTSSFPVGTESCPTVDGVQAVYVTLSMPVAGANAATNAYVSQNGAYTKVYTDAAGRPIRTESQGFDGAGGATPLIYKDVFYNEIGQIVGETEPYFSNSIDIKRTDYQYDKIGRRWQVKRPDGSKTQTDYYGPTVTVTDDLSHVTKYTYNPIGRLSQIEDARHKLMTRHYEPFGNLDKITDSLGNVTVNTYDVRGLRKTAKEPDLGQWTYTYNALGQLVQQKDAKQQVTTLSYDSLGRLVKREEPSLTSSWFYEVYGDKSRCTNGINRLCEVQASNGFKKQITYDAYGRPVYAVAQIGAAVLSARAVYDPNGRISSIVYPEDSFGLTNSYTPLGYLYGVVNAMNTNQVFWRAGSQDARGNVNQFMYGNGLVTTELFDPADGRLRAVQAGTAGAVTNLAFSYYSTGLMKTRVDSNAGVSALYGYDELDRLQSEQLSGTGFSSPQTISWTYDDVGNIATRSDVGTYLYGASGATSVRPHAVLGVAGVVNGWANPQYAYDDNGNTLGTHLNGDIQRLLAWNSFNMVSAVQQKVGANLKQLDYDYDAEHNRVRETLSLNGAAQRQTTYFNPPFGSGLLFELETGSTGTTKKYYLNVGGQTIGVVSKPSSGSPTTRYWHKDALGSVVAVTDENGQVVERLAYEPFGKRRLATMKTDPSGLTAASSTRKGFTAHEMVDDIGLVNMNARMYDPALGRFMSPDTLVDAEDSPQAYNRYSYLSNSPLNGTDPSGHGFFSSVVGAVTGVARAVSDVVTAPIVAAVSPVTSAVTGAVTSLIGGGDAFSIGGLPKVLPPAGSTGSSDAMSTIFTDPVPYFAGGLGMGLPKAWDIDASNSGYTSGLFSSASGSLLVGAFKPQMTQPGYTSGALQLDDVLGAATQGCVTATIAGCQAGQVSSSSGLVSVAAGYASWGDLYASLVAQGLSPALGDSALSVHTRGGAFSHLTDPSGCSTDGESCGNASFLAASGGKRPVAMQVALNFQASLDGTLKVADSASSRVGRMGEDTRNSCFVLNFCTYQVKAYDWVALSGTDAQETLGMGAPFGIFGGKSGWLIPRGMPGAEATTGRN